MKKIKIFCDSCSSITTEDAIKYNVEVIPTIFNLNGVDYNPRDCKMGYEEFYELIEGKAICKTSCINPDTFMEAFKPYLEDGYDILYVAISSGLSGSYQSGILAREMLKEDYKNDIEVIDTLSGSLGIQIALYEACRLRDEGKRVTEIKNALDKNTLNVQALFTIGSLDHLRRGGRVSSLSAVLGTILRINPVIRTNDLGKLVIAEKHRGRKKALDALFNLIKEESTGDIFIGHTNNLEEAIEFEKRIKEYNSNISIYKGYIDTTMGCHCGPRSLAIFYKKK